MLIKKGKKSLSVWGWKRLNGEDMRLRSYPRLGTEQRQNEAISGAQRAVQLAEDRRG